MAKMKSIMAAVQVMEQEGVSQAFGVPGAAIHPLYSALRERGTIAHVLARHVEGASRMAEGCTRAVAGNIDVCIGTSGPAGTDMVAGPWSASADSIPIPCITGQAPRARLHKEDFQAVDITSIVKPVTKWATTVLEPAQVPRAVQQAFHLMRSGRPGPVLIDLPFDVQMAEIEFDIDTDEPLPAYEPAATRKQVEQAIAMLQASERPLIVAGGGIINADASDLPVQFAELVDVPVIPTLMGWGTIADDHRLMPGMCGQQTSHRHGNATMLASDFVLGIGNRWANRHTGSTEVYCKGRTFVHVDIEPTQIGRVFTPDFRQSQRGFSMDYCVPLGFDNINAPELQGYGVDHQKVVEGLGCKFGRMHRQEEIKPAIQQANAWMAEFMVPVVIEVMLERVTHISISTEIDAINEFEELAASLADAPTAIGRLDQLEGLAPQPCLAQPG